MEKNTRKIEPVHLLLTRNITLKLQQTAPIWYMEIPLFNKRSSF